MRVVILFVIPIYLFSTSLSHNEITKMVEGIKVERKGVELDILNETPNPFFIVKKKVVKKPPKKVVKPKKPKKIIPIVEEVYNLTAILNHRAFINGKWYKVGSKIGDYTVYAIGDSSTILKSKKGTKRLIIEKRKSKFDIFKGN